MGKIGKIFMMALLVLLTSFFFFPVGFTFIPPNWNTKMILAVFGLITWGFKSLGTTSQGITMRIAGATALAGLFSLCCLFSAEYNGTGDMSYATYFMSFFVWLFGGYFICACIKGLHDKVTIREVAAYLAAVAVFQCGTALLIDNIPAFSAFVDSIFQFGQEFCRMKRRLYGIGACLDPAGTRFSIVLILVAHVLAANEKIRHSFWSMVLLVGSFLFVLLVGNMISRTTIVGAGMGLAYFFIYDLFNRNKVWSRRPSSMKWIFIGLIGIGLTIVIPLYKSSPSFHHDMRFAFEGFFNWIETGVWHTASTDKLKTVMMIWPTTPEGWIFGTGWFGNWVYATDVGYCRFILYCGLIGFTAFSLFFVYNAVSLGKDHPNCKLLAMFLLALTFIIWLKVATDIFLIYALLYHLDPYDENEEEEEPEEDEEEIEDTEPEPAPDENPDVPRFWFG